MKKYILVLIIVVARLAGFSQVSLPFHQYAFASDSLAGFDEEAARNAALREEFVGEELKVRMFMLKRQFINNKYNLVNYSSRRLQPFYFSDAIPVSPACTNEDFEASTAGVVTSSSQIAGWTCTGGSHAGTSNVCNMLACCPSQPSQIELITCPGGGYIDSKIGGVYPIYSVFGNGNNNGSNINYQVPFPLKGSNIIRINNTNPDFSISRLSKSFSVSNGNSFFQFAFMTVFSAAHQCCDAPAVKISLFNVSAGTLIPCPAFSVSAQSQCSQGSPLQFYEGVSGAPVSGSGGNAVFSKWNVSSVDLADYAGQTIRVDVTVSDCTAGGHFGCVYFDAQCGQMILTSNNNPIAINGASVNIPTCGPGNAIVAAPVGMGPYSWSSGVMTFPAGAGIPSNTNALMVVPQSGTFQLTMNPPGACQPVTKIINLNVTSALFAAATITQAGCTNTTSIASLTTTPGSTINWNPPPGSLSGNSLVATALPVGITTISVQDPSGCSATTTLNVAPAPPPVTFTINNLSGSNNITCANPTLYLQAVSNYTYGALNYSWTSPSFTANTSSISVTYSNTFTVTATDANTGCMTVTSLALGSNTTAPTNTVMPAMQTVSCNAGVTSFTGSALNPTVNILHEWYSPLNPLPGGVPMVSSGNSVSILSAQLSPGIYTLVTTNLVNGCKINQTFTVTSLDYYPTFSMQSSTNYSVGCAPLNQTTLCIVNAMSTQTTPATCSYTFLAPTFTGVVTPSVILGNNTCTIGSLPGSWTVVVQDNGNFCRSILPVKVTQNTVAPNVAASMITQTLFCYMPNVLATGSSTTPNTVVEWMRPVNPPLVSSPTLMLGPPNGPNTSTSSLAYASYTVIATNTVNGCSSQSIVSIFQNFKPPFVNPSLVIGTPTAIYCGTNPAVISVGNSSVIPGPFPFITNPCWAGPVPQASVCGPASYSCYMPGTYTLTITDNYNGCTASGTVNVQDQRQPPALSNSVSTASVNCGATALLTIGISGSTTGLVYRYTEYPPGAAFTPTNAILGMFSQTATVNKAGTYQYIVTNTVTGCVAAGTIVVSLNDPVGQFTVTPIQPSCLSCCDAFLNLSAPPGFTNYAVSTTAGTLAGTPVNKITNLCYGKVVYCFTNNANSCSYCDSLYIDAFTGLSSRDNQSGLSLYPNPASGMFFISNPQQLSGTVKIYNVEGKEMKRINLEREIKIEGLEPGIYFVELSHENGVLRKKIILLN